VGILVQLEGIKENFSYKLRRILFCISKASSFAYKLAFRGNSSTVGFARDNSSNRESKEAQALIHIVLNGLVDL
jgi:hypothetical protein